MVALTAFNLKISGVNGAEPENGGVNGVELKK